MTQPSGDQYRSPQESYPSAPSPSEYYQPQQQAPYYPPQGQYPPPQQGYDQPQQYQQPSPVPYGQPPQYPQPGSVPYRQPVYGVPLNQSYGMVKNVRAGRAMIYGILSVVLGMLTLVTLVGFAGIITGIFAVIYGFIALNASKTLPNNMGRGKALTGIILGIVAIGLVIVSFIIRAGTGG